MIIDLKGKRALVTGSTAGIGYAIAEGLAAAGAAVVINGRGESRVKDAVARLRKAAAHVEGFAADLSSAAGVQHLAERVHETDSLVSIMSSFERKSLGV